MLPFELSRKSRSKGRKRGKSKGIGKKKEFFRMWSISKSWRVFLFFFLSLLFSFVSIWISSFNSKERFSFLFHNLFPQYASFSSFLFIVLFTSSPFLCPPISIIPRSYDGRTSTSDILTHSMPYDEKELGTIRVGDDASDEVDSSVNSEKQTLESSDNSSNV